MSLILRDYQDEAVQSIYSYFREKEGNPVIAMPTGTGKAVVIAGFLQSVLRAYPRQRVMVLTHVKELVAQNYEKLVTMWPDAPAGINSAGLNQRDYAQSIIFAGIGSVARNPDKFGRIDLILIDEAHLVSPNQETMYARFIAALRLRNPWLKVIGLTATPWRLGHGHITTDGIFTDVCFDITGMDAFNRLIAEGYLMPLIPRATKQILDVNGVHMQGGEYVQGELQLAVDREEITYAAIKECLELAADRKHWLVFASGVEHATHVVEMLDTVGIPAVAVHSKMSNGDRDEAIRGFKSGKYRVAVNNNVLTTGFDFPAIDCIVVLRPTASTVLWVQMLGRGTRPVYAPGYDLQTREGRLAAIAQSDKQNCLVLDFARNTPRLGPINDPVIPHRKGSKGGTAPVRECHVCGTFNHASARHCVVCGTEFTFHVKLVTSAGNDALMRGEAPVIEIFDVDHIVYSHHTKVGKPSSVKVTYYCGLRSFNEFVLFEYEGFGRRKAIQWWNRRSVDPVPATTIEALQALPGVMTALSIRVWVNKTGYPEIMDHCFDGTAFGTREDAGKTAPTTQLNNVPNRTYGNAQESSAAKFDDMDDDIPF